MLREREDLFDIYTAKEEYESKKDQHGRFLYQFSDSKEILLPVVSEYLVNKGFNVDWPENHKFASCLTHDVDNIFPSWKYILFTVTKFAFKLKLRDSLIRLIGKIKKDNSKNPYWNFKKILELEEKYSATSSFYFKTASKDLVGWTYDVEILKDELGYILDMGGEVGLHGGYYSYNNSEKLKEEKNYLEKILGRRIVGIRMHYLRFNVPLTWRLLADFDFEYDTTFGFPDMPGFRNGMCHPFRPYDLDKGNSIDILEIPLTIPLVDKKVLLFDDVDDSGETMIFSLDYLKNFGALSMTTATLFHKPHSKYQPDFYGVETSAWVIFPHEKREGIVGLARKWERQGLHLQEIKKRLIKIGLPKKEIDLFLSLEKIK
ncbi:MAG: phosphoribosyltransferase family protein [Candidatus Jordarchaeaceae archaeon]